MCFWTLLFWTRLEIFFQHYLPFIKPVTPHPTHDVGDGREGRFSQTLKKNQLQCSLNNLNMLLFKAIWSLLGSITMMLVNCFSLCLNHHQIYIFITEFAMNDHQNFSLKNYSIITKINYKSTNYCIDFIVKFSWISTKMFHKITNMYFIFQSPNCSI